MIDSYWAIPENDDDISHYGVKGMKWGVRKSEYRSMSRSDRKAQRAKYKTEFVDKQNSSYTKRQRELDRKLYGRRAVKRMNEGMNQGYTHKQVVTKEKVRATRRGALIGAAVGAGEMAIMTGAAQRGAKKAAVLITKLQLLGPAMKMNSFKQKTAMVAGEAFVASRGINDSSVMTIVGNVVSEKRRRF